jgi:hypothetical protein
LLLEDVLLDQYLLLYDQLLLSSVFLFNYNTFDKSHFLAGLGIEISPQSSHCFIDCIMVNTDVWLLINWLLDNQNRLPFGGFHEVFDVPFVQVECFLIIRLLFTVIVLEAEAPFGFFGI